jgi:hypothetical protein
VSEGVTKLAYAKALVPLFALVLGGWRKSLRRDQDMIRELGLHCHLHVEWAAVADVSEDLSKFNAGPRYI